MRAGRSLVPLIIVWIMPSGIMTAALTSPESSMAFASFSEVVCLIVTIEDRLSMFETMPSASE